MGLDMYLKGKVRFGGGAAEVSVVGKEEPIFEDLKGKVETIEYELGYWRKANHIHNWFVTNVQDDIDDQKDYTVTKEQLVELRQLCKKLLKKKSAREAKELLPTTDGFFFGGTEIDKAYWWYVKETLKIVKAAIKFLDAGEADDSVYDCSVIYNAWW